MPRQRKNFDTSLKLEVVRMIKEQGLSVQHVSQSMDIGQTGAPISVAKVAASCARRSRTCASR